MNIGIIGGSAAGLYAAMELKRNNPLYDVTVIEQNSKLGKKLYATGNGRCNLLNVGTSASNFNNPEFVAPFLEKYSYASRVDFFNRFGIEVVEEGDLVYPLTKSASTYVGLLEKIVRDLGVNFIMGETILNYECGTDVKVNSKKKEFHFDKLIIATGGKSQPKLGSDGSMLAILGQKGYEIMPARPGLCPIYTEEKTAVMKGLRHEAKVTVYQGQKPIHVETGEVQFKKNGLSGIVIFNCASKIARLLGRDYIRLVLDLFPEIPYENLLESLKRDAQINGSYYLDAFIEPEMQEYILKLLKIKRVNPQNFVELTKICDTLKALTFNFRDFYDFDESQVTVGGLTVSSITMDLASKSEPEVYFIGEILDIDGDCGGHNLTWALVSALSVADSL